MVEKGRKEERRGEVEYVPLGMKFRHIEVPDDFKVPRGKIYTARKILSLLDEIIEERYVGYTFSVLALSFLATQSITVGYRANFGENEDYDLRGHNKDNQGLLRKAVAKLVRGEEEEEEQKRRDEGGEKSKDDDEEKEEECDCVEYEVAFADRVPALLPTKLVVDYAITAGSHPTPVVVLAEKRRFIYGAYAGVGKEGDEGKKGFRGYVVHLVPEEFDVFDVAVEGRIDAVIPSKHGPIPLEFKPYRSISAEHIWQARYYALILDAPFAILAYYSKRSNDVQRVIVDRKNGYRSVSLEELRRILGYDDGKFKLRRRTEGLFTRVDGAVSSAYIWRLRDRRRSWGDKYRNARSERL